MKNSKGNTKKQLELADRRDKIVSLHVQGMSQREIATKLNISVGLVNRDIHKRLSDNAKEHGDTDKLRELMKTHYEMQIRKLHEHVVIAGKVAKAANKTELQVQEAQSDAYVKIQPKILNVLREYRKTFGLDMPQKIDFGLPDGTVLNLNFIDAGNQDDNEAFKPLNPVIEGEVVNRENGLASEAAS